MSIDLLSHRYLCNVLLELRQSPKSFNEIKERLGISPHTLNRRIKELLKYNLIEAIVVQEKGENRIKYRLTSKAKEIIPLAEEFINLSIKISEKIKGPL
jgi:DNA-binding HxlR family transcriptional regulator